jgi:hypothetical protein
MLIQNGTLDMGPLRILLNVRQMHRKLYFIMIILLTFYYFRPSFLIHSLKDVFQICQ